MQNSIDVFNFITAATSYCAYIENYQTQNDKEFLSVIQAKLLALYQAAHKLPDTYPQDYIELQKDIDHVTLERTISFIAERLMDNRYYLHLFNPADESDKDICYGDLLDDIGDIYKDLKRSLLIFGLGADAAKESAIWEFKFTFNHHWGDHCINAIYASHYFLSKGTE
ncbi:DUF5063 domain-containing protein [uncultured Chitinophaga sp.]|jgi:hypothetical protein|uniref:DUF5063 domain-containing protein n=1 Tax=uncultured Chitinophaga sp. TaxID=339340 RepID=UPI002611D76E|nr:DUF5063 domain-containing protein [uncultured Chitinophaga sp.]